MLELKTCAAIAQLLINIFKLWILYVEALSSHSYTYWPDAGSGPLKRALYSFSSQGEGIQPSPQKSGPAVTSLLEPEKVSDLILSGLEVGGFLGRPGDQPVVWFRVLVQRDHTQSQAHRV